MHKFKYEILDYSKIGINDYSKREFLRKGGFTTFSFDGWRNLDKIKVISSANVNNTIDYALSTTPLSCTLPDSYELFEWELITPTTYSYVK